MKYRMLEPHEKPDYEHGDESSLPEPHPEHWILTTHFGITSIREMGGMDGDLKYRRPVDENGRDLK